MKLYDIFEDGQYIGTFNPEEIEEMTGCKKLSVAGIARTSGIINDKYAVSTANDRTLNQRDDKRLLMEFEIVCELILQIGKRRGKR